MCEPMALHHRGIPGHSLPHQVATEQPDRSPGDDIWSYEAERAALERHSWTSDARDQDA